jgi:hypothetical protein
LEDFKNTWFFMGYVEYEDTFARVTGRRTITAYDPATGTVRVHPPLLGMQPGADMTFYAGCDGTTKQCHLKFGNLPRCGADPVLPLTNPYAAHEETF